MQTKNEIKIIAVEEINSTALQFKFNVEWTMDDKNALIEHILFTLSAKIIKTLQGADLYCLRINYRHYEMLLYFEEYSHACWLECVTEQDSAGLQEIKQLLSYS